MSHRHPPASPPEPEHGAAEQRRPEMTRRELGRLLGASAALAGAGGCFGRPHGTITTAAGAAPETNPGVPVEYATSMSIDGFAVGLLAWSRDGRPIKVEGNPEHPASLGAAGVMQQASVLSLYDPDRLREVSAGGVASSWLELQRWAAGLSSRTRLWLLMHPHSSPHLEAVIARLRRRFPALRVVYDTPIDRTSVYRGAELALGRPLETQYDFAAARVVVSLGADFLAGMPMSLGWARRFAERRRLASARGEMSRLYVTESCPTPTSSLADHHIRVRPGDVASVATALWLAASGGDADRLLARHGLGRHAPAVRAAAADLAAHRGAGAVIAGDRQPAEVHALVHLLNARLGNVGGPVSYTEPVLPEPLGGATLSDFVAAGRAGEIDLAVLVEGNPVYTAPPELGVAAVLERLPATIHLTQHRNETATRCQWNVPAAHYLESWGDGRAYDGTVSFIQPLTRPLWDGRSACELLTMLGGDMGAVDRVLLADFWRGRIGADPERAWRRHLRRGFLQGSALAPVSAAPTSGGDQLIEAIERRRRALADGFELELVPSEAVYDGRFANNAWLLEMPHTQTKLSWDNAALISPDTARRRGLENGDRAEIAVAGRAVTAPIMVLPGHADGCATLALGYGRGGAEKTASGVGVDAYPLRSLEHLWVRAGVALRRVPGKHLLARAQLHFEQDDREIALHSDLEGYRADPDFTAEQRGAQATLLSPPKSTSPQWGMSIDTSVCTGCSACVVACQAENNIPVVGKSGVDEGRIMQWIRIDTYRRDRGEATRVINQPMLCQHCEHAPCEYVCPVYATTHSPDGLNEMTYNRCIGTRFCSNNCPYKVRRFNWFDFTDWTDDSPVRLQYNPDVTVRARGVMEKCTYCVQRIRRHQIEARVAGRELATDEVRTACQQACPTNAIVFGDVADPDSEVSRLRRSQRRYVVLHETGTRPRTQYLAKITNPNPALGKGTEEPER